MKLWRGIVIVTSMIVAVVAPSQSQAQLIMGCVPLNTADLDPVDNIVPGTMPNANTLDTPACYPAPPSPVAQLAGSTFVNSDGTKKTMCWGSVHWYEPANNCTETTQSFVLYQPSIPSPTPQPLIVYFHPNGSKAPIAAGSDLYKQIVQPAIDKGWSVASIEFRHPVVDQYLAAAPENKGMIPQNDTGVAIQYLRSMNVQLHFNPNWVFGVGYSRGSLVLWQSLQPDMGNSSSTSSLIQGYFGYQSQTTYQCMEFANKYTSDPANFNSFCVGRNPYASEFTSAQMSVYAQRATAPPVELRYADMFSLKANGVDIKLIPSATMESLEYIHYPDMGKSLCTKYSTAGIASICESDEDQVPLPPSTKYPLGAFTGYIDYFVGLMPPQ